MQGALISTKTQDEDFYDSITQDIGKNLIQFISERGHGKSSAVKTIVKKIRMTHPEYIFYIYDISQTWFESAPVKYRQLVTVDKIKNGQIVNVGDCVYEMGGLSVSQRRVFVGTMIAQHYKARYNMKLIDSEAFKALPTIIYIIEESNVIFGSYSFRIKDYISPILDDFVSVGRNYKLSAILIATVEESEMAPSLRRRSRRIYGRLVAEGDISRVRRNSKEMAKYLSQEIPRFNFVYWGESGFIGPVKVPDEVKTPAEDYPLPEAQPQSGGKSSAMGWLFFGFMAVIGVYMFLSYFGVI